MTVSLAGILDLNAAPFIASARCLIAGLLGWLLATTVIAQAAPAAADAPAPAAEPRAIAISPADIPSRADVDEDIVQEILNRAEVPDLARRYEEAFALQSAAVQKLVERSGKSDLTILSLRRLESLQRHWLLYERAVAQTRAELARSLNAKSEDAGELASRRAVWQATAQAEGLSPALLARVQEMVARFEAAEPKVSAPLARLLALGRKGSALATQVQAGVAGVTAKIDEQDRRLAVMEAPPLWQALNDPGSLQPVALGLRRSLEIERAFAADYDAANARWLPALAAGALLLLPAMVWLRLRARHMVADGVATEQSVRALSRPWAAWLLLVLLGAVVYDVQGPIFRQQAVMLLAWIPVLALVQTRVLALVGPWAYLSAVFYFFNTLASMLLGNQMLYRGVLFGLNLVMLLALTWGMLRASAERRRAQADPAVDVPVRWRWMSVVRWIAFGVLLVSTGANVLGNVSLSTMLTGALLDSSYAALAMYAGATVLVAFGQVLYARPVISRLAGRRAGSLILLAAPLGRAVLIGAWLVFTLQSFRLYRPLSALLVTVLTHEFKVGQLALSLGSIASFAVATWVAFWLARTIRLVLAEDVLPSLALPRGVGNSISTLSYYSVLFVGMLMALAAAGLQVGQLAILLGALGVGIGIGLQDVVRNFVSGLILMFERPIQPGDVVDVAGMSGRVRDIGMRATIVTTWEGAEVVVPNGMLLADKLVNWTLHGTRRRTDINVATDYTVAPQRTIELLQSIACNVQGVAKSPAPLAILTGLAPGQIEFNLRVWTTESADWLLVRSALAVQVQNGLAEAGIAVPRPQRDVHLNAAERPAGGASGLAASPPP
jgi:potassium efflux system protein